jgi:hypothetical protein
MQNTASSEIHPARSAATGLERRKHRRKTGLWNARLDTACGAFACNVLNISKGGAMLYLAAPVAPKQIVALAVERLGTLVAEVVWRIHDKNKVGLRFTEEPEKVVGILGDMLPPDPPTDLQLGI